MHAEPVLCSVRLIGDCQGVLLEGAAEGRRQTALLLVTMPRVRPGDGSWSCTRVNTQALLLVSTLRLETRICLLKWSPVCKCGCASKCFEHALLPS